MSIIFAHASNKILEFNKALTPLKLLGIGQFKTEICSFIISQIGKDTGHEEFGYDRISQGSQLFLSIKPAQ